MTTKFTVSVSDADARFLDELVRHTKGVRGRSGAVQVAIRKLREQVLEQAYEDADDEWYGSGDAQAWDATVGDGLAAGDKARGGEKFEDVVRATKNLVSDTFSKPRR